MTDIAIVSTARTGMAKSVRGSFNATHPIRLAAHAISHAMQRAAIDPAEVEDVLLGTSHPEGAIANRGHLLHHPAHARTVKQQCDATGVPATIYFALAEPRLEGDHQIKLREFLLRQLKAPAPTN